MALKRRLLVYRKKPKTFHYNAKALPEGTVRDWGGQQYKKESGEWVKVTRAKDTKEKKQPINKDIVKDFRDKWKNIGANVDLYYSDKNNRMQLSTIVIPKEKRDRGLGSKFMKDLIDLADKGKSTITLTPSSDYGGNVTRLKEFYKRFGFVENKGKNRDFEISDDMYRLPNG